MAGHEQTTASITEETRLGPRARSAMGISAVVGLAAILISIVLAFHSGAGRFYFAWLTAWSSLLAIALGALFFVMTQHLTAAGWSVTVRRVAEALSVTLPVLGVLSLPI
ncbi:MAG: quinol:cytochrome C oxidoreductase, partial [Tepidisphaerales bacterium]